MARFLIGLAAFGLVYLDIHMGADSLIEADD